MAIEPHRLSIEVDTRDDDPWERERRQGTVPAIPRIRVLCIGATGQSGSTLLSRMLGRLPSFVAVGEVGRIWDKGLMSNVGCGCGAPFRSCRFWSQVGDEAFGGWDEIDPAEAVRLRDAVTLKARRAPHAAALPFILHPALWPALRADLEAYAALLGRVYRALDRVTEGRIIVDSMKLPGHVYLASTMPGLDARVVHLTRDPRGYAYSNTRWIEHQGGQAGSFRARRTPSKSAVKWSWCNTAFEELARRGTPTRRVRYEDLVRSPRTTLLHAARVMDVSLPDDALWFVGDAEVQLVPQHLAAGSRWRLRHGATVLRPDDAWRGGLAPADRRTVSALTWPMRRRYGYRA
jgi:Sulfotransferase family